jgi:cytochrome c biogenesis protein CcdA
MEKEVQLFVVAVIGVVAIGTALYTRQTDLAQVCIAGLIGFLGGKTADFSNNRSNNEPIANTTASTKIKEETEEETGKIKEKIEIEEGIA